MDASQNKYRQYVIVFLLLVFGMANGACSGGCPSSWAIDKQTPSGPLACTK